ncbi:MAG: hypothetical protein D6761_10910 [Candidatus Dadabacteria bacterium]|nr:MAG: hypothetical protein D6761_10910 [Candidatus Dadabacteria bacterium]
MAAPPPRLVEWMLSPAGDRVFRLVQRIRQRTVLGHSGPVVFAGPRDPHAVLLLTMLNELGAADWPVIFVDSAGLADAERAMRWAVADARELVRQLDLPVSLDHPPDESAVSRLAAALPDPCTVAEACPALESLWAGQVPDREPGPGRARLERGNQLLERLGHYLGALVLSGGDWYWGVDRLGYLFPEVRQRFPDTCTPAGNEPVELYFSFRSPYSWIALDRLMREPAFSDVDLRIRPVLPMVLRGLPVPAAKRLYIARDAAREARLYGVPFGRICDPVPAGGIPAAMARVPDAMAQGVLPQYCQAVARAIWAEGRNVARRQVLERVIADAGLPALAPSSEDEWRELAQRNRDALNALGLWGVPVMHWRDCALWGQDRLAILAQRMREDDGSPLGERGA